MRRFLSENCAGVTVGESAKKRINDRIAFVNSLMAAGKFHILCECTRLRAGLSEAVWDPDSACDKRLDDFTSDIDILDAMEYSVERYMARLT